MMNEADWSANVGLPGSVSEGTLRTVDLILTFVSVLKYLRPATNLALLLKYSGWVRDPDGELAVEYLSELVSLLENCAPEGYYFGTLEGDGACIGFWEVPDEG